MEIQEAHNKVLAWLDAGGTPTAEIPFRYSYYAGTPTSQFIDGSPFFACAGAAIAYLMGEKDAVMVGRLYYEGGIGTFHEIMLKEREKDFHLPSGAASFLRSLEPIKAEPITA